MNSDSFEHLSNEILQQVQHASDILAVAGLLWISKTIVKANCLAFSFLKTHIISRASRPNLVQLYGGEWAVITGSSEGIGRAYADELAKRGLNIVLISNDVKALQLAALDINEKYGVQVDFICLTVDGDTTKYDRIKEHLEGKTIGILVNNVGVMYDYPQMFLDVPRERLWQLVNVNVAATTIMTHMILPQMVERGRGAIVNVSAGACGRPTPQMTVYSATKAYIDLFSRSLAYEYRDQGIVIQSLIPFYVATRRLQRYSDTLSKPKTLIPTAEEYARHAVQTLGWNHRTTGYWPHTIQAWIAWLLPESIWMWGATRFNNALRRQALEHLRTRSQRNLLDPSP